MQCCGQLADSDRESAGEAAVTCIRLRLIKLSGCIFARFKAYIKCFRKKASGKLSQLLKDHMLLPQVASISTKKKEKMQLQPAPPPPGVGRHTHIYFNSNPTRHI